MAANPEQQQQQQRHSVSASAFSTPTTNVTKHNTQLPIFAA
jgi:hypothetical protein